MEESSNIAHGISPIPPALAMVAAVTMTSALTFIIMPFSPFGTHVKNGLMHVSIIKLKSITRARSRASVDDKKRYLTLPIATTS